MPPDLSIYIHWPFCLKKCPYCDFNSHVRRHFIDQEPLRNSFKKEMLYLSRRTGPRLIKTIFFGGGTPSLMEADTVKFLLDSISEYWQIEPDAEITLEANPSSSESQKFFEFQRAGVNRLSLGIQALNNHDLKLLGRQHNTAEALRAINIARSIFPRISFDLIYARPKQTLENWLEELEQALALASDHLSLYQLTLEPGTVFYHAYHKKQFSMLSDQKMALFYSETRKRVMAKGYYPYEISNYARPGGESLHNHRYWRYNEYIGIGPGAHGRFVEDDRYRTVTIAEKNPERYILNVKEKGHGIVEEEYLNAIQQSDEYLLMGLRIKDGINLLKYKQLSGRSLDKEKILKLKKEGLIFLRDGKSLCVTSKGMLFVDYILKSLVVASAV